MINPDTCSERMFLVLPSKGQFRHLSKEPSILSQYLSTVFIRLTSLPIYHNALSLYFIQKFRTGRDRVNQIYFVSYGIAEVLEKL